MKQRRFQIPNLIKLYCIDSWTHIDKAPFEAGRPQEWQDIMYNTAVKRLDSYGDKAKILKMPSDDAISYVPDDVDFVWIDGNHEKEQVRRDVVNWLPKVKEGGIFGGHDYQIEYIREIVKEELGWHNTGEDFTWWIIKKTIKLNKHLERIKK